MVPGGVLCVSIYLVTGSGLGAESKLILGELGEYLQSVQVPFVPGGDWNCDPAALEEWGWLQKIGGMLVSCGQNTCRIGEGSEIDYFVVSTDLASRVKQRQRLQSAPAPH